MPRAKNRPAAKKASEAMLLVSAYVESLTGWKREVATELRKIIRSASRELTEEVKWGWPCYTAGGKNICGFMDMQETVNLVLYLGALLDGPAGLIEGTGKSMRHIKLRGLQDIRKSTFTSLIKKSIKLVKE